MKNVLIFIALVAAVIFVGFAANNGSESTVSAKMDTNGEGSTAPQSGTPFGPQYQTPYKYPSQTFLEWEGRDYQIAGFQETHDPYNGVWRYDYILRDIYKLDRYGHAVYKRVWHGYIDEPKKYGLVAPQNINIPDFNKNDDTGLEIGTDGDDPIDPPPAPCPEPPGEPC